MRLLLATCKTPHTHARTIYKCCEFPVSVCVCEGEQRKANKINRFILYACVSARTKENQKATVDNNSHIKSFSPTFSISFALFSFVSEVSATFVAATWQQRKKLVKQKSKQKANKEQLQSSTRFPLGPFKWGDFSGWRHTYPKMRSRWERDGRTRIVGGLPLVCISLCCRI